LRHLDSAERRLALEAALLTAAVRLGLSALSLRTIGGLLARLSAARSRRTREVVTIARAATRAAAIVPGSTCLVQALVAQALLRRRGHPARLRVGFRRDESGALAGHAWVESGSRVLDGAGQAARYAPDPAGQGS
jgi:hypothetical protein